MKTPIRIDYQPKHLVHPNCFKSLSQYEIATFFNQKIIGSAQFFTKNAVLQQGTIQLFDNNQAINKYWNSIDQTSNDKEQDQ